MNKTALLTAALLTLATTAGASELELKVENANLNRRLILAQADAAQCDAGWSQDRAKLAQLLLRDADAKRKADLEKLKEDAKKDGREVVPVHDASGQDTGLVELKPVKE